MDPLTQGLLGAAPAALFSKKAERRTALVLGALAGMAPDLDVLIRSPTDPLFAIEYHRHFTHSLAFVPIGALVCAAVFWVFLRKKLNFARIYLWSFLGYATHGLLDACTSYGTQLYWPFSNHRVEWNIIGIIDPIFTGLLLCAVGLSFLLRQRWVKTLVAVAMAYLVGFGTLQKNRAQKEITKLAESRGHQPIRVEVKPTVFNLFAWRGIYEFEGRFYVDAVHVGLSTRVYEGSSVDRVIERPQSIVEGSVLAQDIERFRWFSADYLFVNPRDPEIIGDLRFSLLPNSIDPLWGIRIRSGRESEHAPYEFFRNPQTGQVSVFLKMIFGREI
jgi:inner membrane protein